MARKPRVHFPTGLYHVIARGNQKQVIFSDERDFRTYLSYLSEYKNKHSFRLYAYALMETHLHLLLEVGGSPLSKAMQVLQFRRCLTPNSHMDRWGYPLIKTERKER